MARGGIELLQVNQLKTKKPGLKSDGGNLYLRTFKAKDGSLTRSWIFRYQLPGHVSSKGKRVARDMGLGSLDSIGLAKAREIAGQARELVAQGIDPIENHKQTLAVRRAEESKKAAIPTFDECAKDYINAHRAGWRNPKHAAQWHTTLRGQSEGGKKTTHNYCAVLQKMPVNEITKDDILKVLKPIWHEKTDTAKRVRGRIEAVLNYASAHDYRNNGDGEPMLNPARWQGHLDNLLASPEKIAPVEHHTALDYKRVGEFMAQLRQREGIGALALEFCILTAARTGETVGATWDEIDMDEKVWTVPANRIKAGREHQVPLSRAALAVLHKARAITKDIGGAVAKSDLVFPNDRSGEQLSANGLSSILKRMKYGDVTVHGMRSCFRDWAGEESHFPNDVIELALAHTVGDKTERAYRRKTGFAKRRLLAEAWSSYIAKPVADAKVLAFAKP